MLSAMLSGRHPLQKHKDGSIFLDRSPKFFKIILEFLRTGSLLWPESASERKMLYEEISFFGLDEAIPTGSFACS